MIIFSLGQIFPLLHFSCLSIQTIIWICITIVITENLGCVQFRGDLNKVQAYFNGDGLVNGGSDQLFLFLPFHHAELRLSPSNIIMQLINRECCVEKHVVKAVMVVVEREMDGKMLF